MDPWRDALVGALCGTALLGGCIAASLASLGSLGIENTGASIEDRRAASVTDRAEHAQTTPATAIAEDEVVVADMESDDATLADPGPMPPTATGPVRLATVSTGDLVQTDTRAAASFVETPDECIVPEICIDEYLWSLCQRTPKVDTNKVRERIQGTVKKKSKTRTIIKTVAKYVEADFTCMLQAPRTRHEPSFIPYRPTPEHHDCRDWYKRSERNSNLNAAHLKSPAANTLARGGAFVHPSRMSRCLTTVALSPRSAGFANPMRDKHVQRNRNVGR
jgi:hypothetical protein